MAWAMIIAANGTAQNVQRTSQGIKYAAQGMNVSVEFYSPSIVRVYKTPGETASDKESLVVIKAPEQTPDNEKTDVDNVQNPIENTEQNVEN